MLEVHDLVSSYGRIEVLHGISLKVRGGEVVALVGANGAGKTTLLRAISGVQPIRSGQILFDNQPIEAMPAHRRLMLGMAQVAGAFASAEMMSCPHPPVRVRHISMMRAR